MKPYLLFLLTILSAITQSLGQTTPKSSELKEQWDWKQDQKGSQRIWQEQEDLAFHSLKKWQTNAVLIIKNDEIVYEKYANDFTQTRPHRLWSISKSFSSALIGKRLSEKQWPIHKLASDIMEELNQPIKRDITFRDLLQMSSGLAWNEFYEANPFSSHVVDMLYIENFKDMGLFTAKRKSRARPGNIFNYSSGETNLLMRLLKLTFEGQELYDDYPWNTLFDPIGITSATWEQDQSGSFVGSSYLFMTARDLARFGRLYLLQGKWQDGIEIIPKDFVMDSLKIAPAVCQTLKKKSRGTLTYGHHWWLNKKCPNDLENYIPGVDEDLFMALGHHGQILAVFPKQNAIAVRFGADKLEKFDRNTWIQLVYKALGE
ncbi:MAG: beta-lactamase family protein [Bacteriovoracaceae bacterium]|nr:beta-lactamase family protein [Bacteriovoracaceae bacterium]